MKCQQKTLRKPKLVHCTSSAFITVMSPRISRLQSPVFFNFIWQNHKTNGKNHVSGNIIPSKTVKADRVCRLIKIARDLYIPFPVLLEVLLCNKIATIRAHSIIIKWNDGKDWHRTASSTTSMTSTPKFMNHITSPTTTKLKQQRHSYIRKLL